MKKKHINLNAASIVRRLSFHQQLNESQSTLIKCTPIWQNWSQQNLVEDTDKAIILSHFGNGELIIHCQNAIAATQIKRQQQTLLEYFNNQGMLEIKKITVNINNNSSSLRGSQNNLQNKDKNLNTNQGLDKKLNPSSLTTAPDSLASLKLRNNAIKSIKSCEKITTNKELSESLNRLRLTIEQHDK